MFLHKLGLYEDKDILRDIPVGAYKPYEYTQQEFNYLKDEYSAPIIKVTFSKDIEIKIKNGYLYINKESFNISSLIVEDIIYLLKSKGADIKLLSDYEDLRMLPAFLLTETSNKLLLTSPIHSSPTDINNDIKPLFKGITPLTIKEKSLKIFREDNNLSTVREKEKEFERVGDKIYTEVEEGLIMARMILATSFYLHVDFNTKILRDATIISKLLPYRGETE